MAQIYPRSDCQIDWYDQIKAEQNQSTSLHLLVTCGGGVLYQHLVHVFVSATYVF